MSQDNPPTVLQEKTAVSQSRMQMLVRLFGNQVRDVQGNVKWDTIKFIYNHRAEILAALLLMWGAMNAFIAALIQKLLGIPIDWLIIGLLGVVSIIPMLIFAVIGRRILSRLTPSVPDAVLPPSGESAAPKLEEKPSPSMNDLIRAVARDIEKVPCGEGWLHSIAEYDRTQIQNAVIVRGIAMHNLMDDGIPKLEFVFSIFNKSVYQISIDDAIDGHIRFEQEKLKKHNLEMQKNAAVDLLPRSSGYFTLEQTLLDSEARYIKSRGNDRLFWFDQ